VPRLNANPLVLLLATTAIAVFCEFLWLNWLQTTEFCFTDLFISGQARNIKPDPDIIVVAADDQSLQQLAGYAGRWPWPRSIHAELVQGIEAQRPRAIVFGTVNRYSPGRVKSFFAMVERWTKPWGIA